MSQKTFLVFGIILILASSGCLDFFENDDDDVDQQELDDNSNQQNDDMITPVGNTTNIAPYVTAGVWNDNDDFMLVDETNMTAISYIYVNWAAKDIDGTISSAGFDLDLDMVIDIPVDSDFGTIINPSPDEYYEGALPLSFESNWQYDRMFYPNEDGGFEGCAISMHYTFAFIAIDDSGDSGITLSQYVSPYLIGTDWDNETMELLGVPSSEIDWLGGAECIDEPDNTCASDSDCPPGTLCVGDVCVEDTNVCVDGAQMVDGGWTYTCVNGQWGPGESVPDGTVCDDGDENTEGDVYVNGSCQGTAIPNNPPVIYGLNFIPETVTNETEQLSFDLDAADADDDDFSVSVSVSLNDEVIDTRYSNTYVNFVFDLEEYQIEVGDNLCFAVTVDDGEASNSKTYCVEIEEPED